MVHDAPRSRGLIRIFAEPALLVALLAAGVVVLAILYMVLTSISI